MSILLWLATPFGRLVAGAAAILVFLSAFALDQRQRGAEKAVAKIEKVTTDAVRKADRAGARSRSDARGVRDPYTLAD